MVSPSKDKIDELYGSLQLCFNIEDDGEVNKYLVIDLDLSPDGSIHISQPFLTQSIFNMIMSMYK